MLEDTVKDNVLKMLKNKEVKEMIAELERFDKLNNNYIILFDNKKVNVKTFIQQCESEGIPNFNDFRKNYFLDEQWGIMNIFNKPEVEEFKNGYCELLKRYNKYLEEEAEIIKKGLTHFYKYGTRMASDQISDYIRLEAINNKIEVNEDSINKLKGIYEYTE